MEIYVSTDVEADGPIPGLNSMLSFASAAYTADKQLLCTFSANLETLPGASPDPKTAKWWLTQPEAWAACRRDQRRPEDALREYAAWVKALPGKPVFVGYPATYDFLFIQWYLVRFVGHSPFGFSALDVKSYAMALLKKEFRETSMKIGRAVFGKVRNASADYYTSDCPMAGHQIESGLGPEAKPPTNPLKLLRIAYGI